MKSDSVARNWVKCSSDLVLLEQGTALKPGDMVVNYPSHEEGNTEVKARVLKSSDDAGLVMGRAAFRGVKYPFS